MQLRERAGNLLQLRRLKANDVVSEHVCSPSSLSHTPSQGMG
jgi:hypothetical protein